MQQRRPRPAQPVTQTTSDCVLSTRRQSPGTSAAGSWFAGVRLPRPGPRRSGLRHRQNP